MGGLVEGATTLPRLDVKSSGSDTRRAVSAASRLPCPHASHP